MGKFLPVFFKSRYSITIIPVPLSARRFYVLVLLFLLTGQSAYSFTITSQANDYWNNPSTWNGGQVPAPGDDVFINSEVTIAAGSVVEVNSLTISRNSKLNIYGALIIREDLVMENNGSQLTTGEGSSIVVFGNALLDNRVSIDLSSYFIVLGDFLRTASENQGTISVAGAQIYIFGSVSSSWDNFTACQPGTYDGTTSSVGDDCDAGQYDDFIAHIDPEKLPDDVYTRIISCSPAPTAVLSGDAELCDGGSMASLSIHFTGTAPWNILVLLNGNGFLNLENIVVNPYSFHSPVAGLYTLGSMEDAFCNGTVSGNATVVVNPAPLTGQILPD